MRISPVRWHAKRAFACGGDCAVVDTRANLARLEPGSSPERIPYVTGWDRWRYYAWRYRARRDPEREPDDREQPRGGPVRRILWRRRAWGWIAVLGLAGYLALGTTLLIEGTTPGGIGPGTVLAGTVAEWLALPVGAGVLGAFVESRLLRRLEHAARPSLLPRSSPAWWLGVLALLGLAIGLMIFPVSDLPEAVNAWGYATGAEPSATFVPDSQSYQECSSNDSGQTCTWYTDGYLEQGHQHVVQPGYVRAGTTLRVSGPLWDWLRGNRLISDAGYAAAEIIIGFIAGLLALASLFVGGLALAVAFGLALNKME
jgi:hypothetical protein